MVVTAFDAMNDALEQGSELGFEMVPGFATHWAMGAETLIELGHPDDVHDWVSLYPAKHKHFPRPDTSLAIDPADESSWRAALGDFGRAGDWQSLFERELTEAPWREVVVRWWPRLMPGIAAGLTHGLIRTMHSIRSIDGSPSEPTALQLRELATGLSYWAARYVEQPGPALLAGPDRLPGIIASIPRHADTTMRLLDRGLFKHMPGVRGWPQAVGRLARPEDIGTALSDMTLAFAQVNMTHPDQFPVPLIHTVTAPAALRLMLRYLPDELHLPSFTALWQCTAALLSTFAPARPGEIAETADHDPQPALSPAELAERAAEHGDEHAMKYTEACLREHALRPDPRYLLAAERMLGQLRPYWRQ